MKPVKRSELESLLKIRDLLQRAREIAGDLPALGPVELTSVGHSVVHTNAIVAGVIAMAEQNVVDD